MLPEAVKSERCVWEVDRTIELSKRLLPIIFKPVSDAEILSRIMVALANEGARVLEDGYATRAGDIDVIYCYGFGYPRHHGGPMFYADTVGLPAVLAKVKEYRARFGDYWQPAPLLERMVAEGRSFYGNAATV